MRDADTLIFQLVFMVVAGAIAAAVASSKGRSAAGWFFGGFFLGLIGIIIVACLSNLNEKRRREEYVDRENRRLREQLMQEQIKNEAFRRHAAARLDQHDVQIGVDTRSIVPALGAAETQPMLPNYSADAPLVGADTPAAPTADDGNPWRAVVVNDNGHDNGAANNWSTPFTPPLNGAPPANGAPLPPPTPVNGAAAAKPARMWHYESAGETRGPIDDRQLVALAKTGEVTAETLVWTEQLGEWKAAGQIKPLQVHLRS